MTYRSSVKVVAINQIFRRVMPLEPNHFMGFYSLHALDFFSFQDFFPQCVQLLHFNFVHAFISIRFKIKLKDDQINSREIDSWDFSYLGWGSVEHLNRANVSTCVSLF
jgi:hypothetical protein